MALEETERRAYEAFYLKKIRKELNSWSKSVAVQIESGTAYATFMLDGRFLSSDRITTILKDLYQTVGDRFSTRTANQLKRLGINTTSRAGTTWAESMESYFKQDGADKIKTIVSTHQDEIKKVINETVTLGSQEGLGVQEISKNITKKLKGKEHLLKNRFNADRIARTEVGSALNKARYEQAELHKDEVWKVWKAQSGARPSHAGQHMERRAFDERFTNGLNKPMEIGGPANEVINCRCQLEFVRKE